MNKMCFSPLHTKPRNGSQEVSVAATALWSLKGMPVKETSPVCLTGAGGGLQAWHWEGEMDLCLLARLAAVKLHWMSHNSNRALKLRLVFFSDLKPSQVHADLYLL